MSLPLVISYVGLFFGCWYVNNNVPLVYLQSLRAGAWVWGSDPSLHIVLVYKFLMWILEIFPVVSSMPIFIPWWVEMVFSLASIAPCTAHILLYIKQSPLLEFQYSLSIVLMLEFAYIALLCNQSLSYDLWTMIHSKNPSSYLIRITTF